jgi:hypothetical protein
MRIWSALLIIAIVGIFAVTAVAADVNGRWIAEMKNPMEAMTERIFTFKVTGNQLTGTIANRNVVTAIFQEPGKKTVTGTLKTMQGGPGVEIAEGKINGDEISFVVNANQGIKNAYTGKVSGNQITFTMETKWPEGYISSAPNPADRVPPKPQQIVAKKAPATD